jgi:hypothetical protein
MAATCRYKCFAIWLQSGSAWLTAGAVLPPSILFRRGFVVFGVLWRYTDVGMGRPGPSGFSSSRQL